MLQDVHRQHWLQPGRPGFRPSAAWTTFAWQVHAGPCWHTTNRHVLFTSRVLWVAHETSFVRTKYTHQVRTGWISMFFPIEIKEFHSRQVDGNQAKLWFFSPAQDLMNDEEFVDRHKKVFGVFDSFIVLENLTWQPFGYICNSFAYVKDTCCIFFEVSRHLFKVATCNLCKPQVDLVLECNDGKLLAHRVICCKACPKLLSKLIPCEDRPNSWRLKDWIWHCWGRRMSTTLLYKGLCSRQLTCKQIKNPFR